MDRQRTRMYPDKHTSGHRLVQNEREDHPKCCGNANRGKSRGHEPSRQGQRTSTPQRARKIIYDERETSSKQKRSDGQERQFRRNASIQPEKAPVTSTASAGSGNRLLWSGRSVSTGMNWPKAPHIVRLSQPIVTRWTTTSVAGALKDFGGETEPCRHHGFRSKQRQQCGCEIQTSSSGKVLLRSIAPPLVPADLRYARDAVIGTHWRKLRRYRIGFFVEAQTTRILRQPAGHPVRGRGRNSLCALSARSANNQLRCLIGDGPQTDD